MIKQWLKISLISFFCVVSQLYAEPRIGLHPAASLWDQVLPEGTHPSMASDLATMQEGRISFGFFNMDLEHLSLSLPGFQIISSNSKWSTISDSSALGWNTDVLPWAADSADTEISRYRGFFRVAGGIALSTFLEPKSWDLAWGVFMDKHQIYDSTEKVELWSERLIGGSMTGSYRIASGIAALSASLAWNEDGEMDEFVSRLSYRIPKEIQVGGMWYQNLQRESAFGLVLGASRYFHESLMVRASLEQQYVDSERIKQLFSMGFVLRFRPWRSEVDPDWLRLFIDPLASCPYLYDWEVALNMAVEQKTNTSLLGVTLSRWF